MIEITILYIGQKEPLIHGGAKSVTRRICLTTHAMAKNDPLPMERISVRPARTRTRRASCLRLRRDEIFWRVAAQLSEKTDPTTANH